jgi:hypothetical protein
MRFMKAVFTTLMLFAIGLSANAAEFDVPNGALVNKIDFLFVGHLDEFDDKGRLLIWEAAIEGELTGIAKWWFVVPGPIPDVFFNPGSISFYEARWEIWDEDEITLLLAGESAGKTVFRDGEDGIWDGFGVVTEAHGNLNPLKGRKIYESGPVLLGNFPYVGTGMFLIH